MKCICCNSELKDGMKFCPRCGNKISQSHNFVKRTILGLAFLAIIGFAYYGYQEYTSYRKYERIEERMEKAKEIVNEIYSSINSDSRKFGDFRALGHIDQKYMSEELQARIKSMPVELHEKEIRDILIYDKWTGISKRLLIGFKTAKTIDISEMKAYYNEFFYNDKCDMVRVAFTTTVEYVSDRRNMQAKVYHSVRFKIDDNGNYLLDGLEGTMNEAQCINDELWVTWCWYNDSAPFLIEKTKKPYDVQGWL